MSKYKLLALDLDGTLLDPHEQITTKVRHAIYQAVEAGCLVTLATGRRLRPARQFAADLGLKLPLILYSGGLVFDTQTERALYHRPLSAEFLKQALEVVLPTGLGLALLQSPVQGEYIWFGPSEYDNPYLHDYATNPMRSDLVKRCTHAELAQVKDVLTVLSVGPATNISDLTERVRSRLECNVYQYKLQHAQMSNLCGFDLLPLANTKAKALEWLAHHYGLTLEQTLVVGDGPNDVEMFKVAGLGVAMGNAIPQVKAVAGAVVGSNSEDGVAQAIERFIL